MPCISLCFLVDSIACSPLLTLYRSQHVRRYASEAPKSGSNNALLYGGIGAAALGGGYFYLNSGKAPAAAAKQEVKKVVAKASGPSKVFTGGDQGFIGLPLESVEDINHNTKKFRFKFEDKESVSGLSIASALITKYQGPNDEKPTIRPYTPTSDEGGPRLLLPNELHI